MSLSRLEVRLKFFLKAMWDSEQVGGLAVLCQLDTLRQNGHVPIPKRLAMRRQDRQTLSFSRNENTHQASGLCEMGGTESWLGLSPAGKTHPWRAKQEMG